MRVYVYARNKNSAARKVRHKYPGARITTIHTYLMSVIGLPRSKMYVVNFVRRHKK